jgi:hypothetical protein
MKSKEVLRPPDAFGPWDATIGADTDLMGLTSQMETPYPLHFLSVPHLAKCLLLYITEQNFPVKVCTTECDVTVPQDDQVDPGSNAGIGFGLGAPVYKDGPGIFDRPTPVAGVRNGDAVSLALPGRPE